MATTAPNPHPPPLAQFGDPQPLIPPPAQCPALPPRPNSAAFNIAPTLPPRPAHSSVSTPGTAAQAPSLPPRPASVQLSVSSPPGQGHQQWSYEGSDHGGAIAPPTLPPRRPSQHQHQHQQHQQAPSLPPRPTSIQLSVSPSWQDHQQGTLNVDSNNSAVPFAPLQHPCWSTQRQHQHQQAPSLPPRSTSIQQPHQATNDDSVKDCYRVPPTRSQDRSSGTMPKLQAATPTSKVVPTLPPTPVSSQTPSLRQRPALPPKKSGAVAGSKVDALPTTLPSQRPSERTEASGLVATAAVVASAVTANARKLPRPLATIRTQSSPHVPEMVAPTTNGEPASSRVTDFERRPLKTPDRPTSNGLGATAGIRTATKPAACIAATSRPPTRTPRSSRAQTTLVCRIPSRGLWLTSRPRSMPR
jgi:hypothetical protein